MGILYRLLGRKDRLIGSGSHLVSGCLSPLAYRLTRADAVLLKLRGRIAVQDARHRGVVRGRCYSFPGSGAEVVVAARIEGRRIADTGTL